MQNHIPLGQIFGIRIWLSRFVLWMVGAIALFNALEDPAYFWPTVFVIAGVLGIVLLHELGHSRVALHYGVKVSHITLWPLGGVAWMEEIPEDPKVEAMIAIAGPAVNFVLALVALPFLFLAPVESSAEAVVSAFIAINLSLGVFNLLPAFPMDGGRILRALLGLRYDWLEATERAVRVGRSVAIAAAIIGFFKGFLIVPFIAVYVWLMGQKELLTMRAKKLGGGGFSFANFANFTRPGANPFAGGNGFGQGQGFMDPGGESHQDPYQQDPYVQDPRDQDAGAPSNPGRSRGGFTDEDIAKLEGFRGRLSRNWKDAE